MGELQVFSSPIADFILHEPRVQDKDRQFPIYDFFLSSYLVPQLHVVENRYGILLSTIRVANTQDNGVKAIMAS